MGNGLNSVNVLDSGGVNPEEAQFEALFSQEVKFFANKRRAFR